MRQHLRVPYNPFERVYAVRRPFKLDGVQLEIGKIINLDDLGISARRGEALFSIGKIRRATREEMEAQFGDDRRDLSELSILELKELARARGLRTALPKAELLAELGA